MERVEQALLKIKENTLRTSYDTVGARSPLEITVSAFSYTRTRVTVPDPELMVQNRIVALDNNSTHAQAFNLLRTKVLRKMDEKGWRTLAVTSPTTGSGKTVVAINLAISIARRTDRTALLVDFDLRWPNVARCLDIPLEISLDDVLDGRADIPDALVNPGIPRLVVIPAAQQASHSAETLSSPMVKALINEVRQRYPERIVVFDLPPLVQTDDAMAVLPQMDCALMVVADGESSQQQIDTALSHMPAINLLGTVINKAGCGR